MRVASEPMTTRGRGGGGPLTTTAGSFRPSNNTSGRALASSTSWWGNRAPVARCEGTAEEVLAGPFRRENTGREPGVPPVSLQANRGAKEDGTGSAGGVGGATPVRLTCSGTAGWYLCL